MKVLLALDDCVKTWDRALDFVRGQEAALTVLFVRDVTWNMFLCHDWLLGSGARADFMEWMRDEEGKAADDALTRFRARARGLAFAEKAAEGDVREQILLEAGQGYDLLVLSNPFFRGLEQVRKAVPALVGACPCDILLVNRQAGGKEE